MPTSRSEIGGGTNARPSKHSLAETGGGVPDEAVGPEQRTVPDQLELAEARQAEALAEKLRREADRFLQSGRGGKG